ncbi:MAG: putative lipid II flippase FtsW [Thermodesulfovibrionia bacterium]|nr:putative lipid II flippase FtsW [Thermodesulfovibrionia bacterium]
MINSRYMSSTSSKSIFLPVIALIFIGVIMVYSSTALLSVKKYGTGFHYLWSHLFTVFIGFAAMLLVSRLDYQKLRPLGTVLLAVSFVLLLVVFLPGIGLTANGARRWIRLWPTTFQPSELAKIAMVLFLADYMDKNKYRMKKLVHGFIIPIAIMLTFQLAIIFQPDFGAVMSLGILTIGLLFLGGVTLRPLFAIILVALPGIFMLVKFFPYRWKRVTCFMDPWQDSLGCGFQLVQSFIAFGNGYITGVGIGSGRQKLAFLPEIHTDFIFSLIGEELGFLGVLAVIGLFLWLLIKGIIVALETDDPFSHYLALGLTMMIGSQVIINLAVTIGLAPTKGLPLPLISYGGSSLLINMIAIGILLNISGRNDRMKMERRGRPDIQAGHVSQRRGR